MTNNEQPSNLMIRIAMPIVVLAVGILGFVALSYLREDPPRENPKVTTAVVKTEAVKLHTGGLEIGIDGLVVPHREVTLSAEVSGRIALKSDACRAGRFVYGPQAGVDDSGGADSDGEGSDGERRGTLLLRIDPRDYQFDVERLTDLVEQADASLEELKVDVANTGILMKLALEMVELQRRELARIENLSRNRVATASQIDEAKLNLLTARDGLVKLSNQQSLLTTRRVRLLSAMDNAGAMLSISKLDLARTEIRSPVGGVVVRDLVEQDAYVQKGTPLVTIEETLAVEVKCSLRMEELYWLWQQMSPEKTASAGKVSPGSWHYEIPRTPVTIEYELSGRTYQWRGELSRYDGIGLDEVTRTVPCRVIVRNPTDVAVVKREVDASSSPLKKGATAGLSRSGASKPLQNTAGQTSSGTPIAEDLLSQRAATRTMGPPALVRGMYVTVRIHATPQTPLLRVSERAVRPGKQIWVVRSGKLEVQKIQIARVVGKDVLIDATASKLKAGDRVVVSPLSGARGGMAVREEKPAK